LRFNPHNNKRLKDPIPMAYVFESLPAQRNLIRIDDPREVSWWSKRFGCSENQLREAVAEVGVTAAQVEQLLDGMEIVTV